MYLFFCYACHTIVAGYYGFTLVISVSVHSAVHPYSHFCAKTFVKIDGFSPNLTCALILWRLVYIANGQIRQFLYPTTQ